MRAIKGSSPAVLGSPLSFALFWSVVVVEVLSLSVLVLRFSLLVVPTLPRSELLGLCVFCEPLVLF